MPDTSQAGWGIGFTSQPVPYPAGGSDLDMLVKDSTKPDGVKWSGSTSGHELGSFVLATTLTGGAGGTGPTTVGGQASYTDDTKDVLVTQFTVNVVVGSRPILIECSIEFLTAVSGGLTGKLYDLTAGVPIDQDPRAVTAFQAQAKLNMRSLQAPAAGARQYGLKVNGTAGILGIFGASDRCSSWLRVVER